MNLSEECEQVLSTSSDVLYVSHWSFITMLARTNSEAGSWGMQVKILSYSIIISVIYSLSSLINSLNPLAYQEAPVHNMIGRVKLTSHIAVLVEALKFYGRTFRLPDWCLTVNLKWGRRNIRKCWIAQFVSVQFVLQMVDGFFNSHSMLVFKVSSTTGLSFDYGIIVDVGVLVTGLRQGMREILDTTRIFHVIDTMVVA